jgi:predicted nucleic acid-binding protein
VVEQVCVDASLALSWVLPMDINAASERLFAGWARRGVVLLGPPLLYAEVVSVIRSKVHRKLLTPEEGQEALDQIGRASCRERVS